MNEIINIIERIKQVKNFKTDLEVAQLFDCELQTLNDCKKENKLPFKYLIDFCINENVSLDWLMFGKR